MKIHQIMTSNPATCTQDAKLSDVARLMVDRDCGQIPVLDGHTTRKPVGVITDRDIVVRSIAKGTSPDQVTAGEVMTRGVATVTPETSVDDALKLMQDRKVRRLPVVDAAGACCGMVAQADLATNVSEKDTGSLVKTISRGPDQKSCCP